MKLKYQLHLQNMMNTKETEFLKNIPCEVVESGNLSVWIRNKVKPNRLKKGWMLLFCNSDSQYFIADLSEDNGYGESPLNT